MKKFKKETNVISVGKPGSGGCIGFNPTKEIPAERWKRIQYLEASEYCSYFVHRGNFLL